MRSLINWKIIVKKIQNKILNKILNRKYIIDGENLYEI